ncbi:hypothetical protein [Massilia sp. Root335]|uniref:hypothetical protein n=1 Tax=Massilia sp. Root335 TaxID=1736517 RepID=UPI0007003644|nr:hypothetical protein [Massilia sp. Root335]KQV51794.1 hypothetical protein ASC93_07650 [Massilia sp. Root335]
MATITIKDLSENTDLDRKAMQAISGGSRARSDAGALRPAGTGPARPQRIVDFRTGAVPADAPDKPPR